MTIETELPAVKVRELEWVYYQTKGYWCANTTVGQYIAWETENGAMFCWNPVANSSNIVFSDLVAAQAAAQADYERRILSALVPSTLAESRCEELVKALEPFSKFAGPVFERNFNNDDPVDTITASDGEQVTLFARDYFAARAVLASYRKRIEADGK